MIDIIQPGVPSQEYVIRLVYAQLQIWKHEREAAQAEYRIENVRFKHDPQWRERFWSIQAAHDCADWRWKFLRVTYFAAAAAPYVIGLIS